MRSLLFGEHTENEAAGRFISQNPWLIKVRLNNSDILALEGSMVAFQGQMNFDHKFSSVAQYFKKVFTKEGIPLMRASGSGDLFLAHNADEIHLIYLENDSLIVNGKNLLAFEPEIDWDIKMSADVTMFSRDGLFNMVLKGTGWVAVSSYGRPVVLNCAEPTFVDFNSVVAWSGNLKTSLKKSFNFKSMIGFGSGEAFEIGFVGQGVVIVQASEGRPPAPEEVFKRMQENNERV